MKIYNKNKYKFLFLLNQPLVSLVHSLPPTANLTEKLKYLVKYYVPSIFYKKREKGVSFRSSSSIGDCMTPVALDIHLATDTLLDYLETFKKIDSELKYNLDCLDKNYNTSELDFLFILDFSLLYKEFEKEIEKELFRQILTRIVDNLYVVNFGLLHSSPHTPLCRTEIILTKDELTHTLSNYTKFEPKEKDLWLKLEKENLEFLNDLKSRKPAEEATLREEDVSKIISFIREKALNHNLFKFNN